MTVLVAGARSSWIRIHGGPRLSQICLFVRQLGKTIEEFTNILKLNKFAIYIFDYGAPTGLR
jgi:hypothetical protein